MTMKHLKIKAKLLLGFVLVSVLTMIVGLAAITPHQRRFSDALHKKRAALGCPYVSI